MKKMKLFDSELKLMELIWNEEGILAKDLARQAYETVGWNKNTTYTVLKKLVEKQAVLRKEPGFSCVPLLSKEEVQYTETRALVDKLYQGSVGLLFSSFLKQEKLSQEELMQLSRLIDSAKEGGE